MAQTVSSQLMVKNGGVPVDYMLTPVTNLAALSEITPTCRFIGMTITVKSDDEGKQSDYWLVGGIANDNWQKKTSSASNLVEIKKLSAATSSAYSESYQLQVSGDSATILGDIINIPKDFRVVSHEFNTVTAADKGTGGKFEGDSAYSIGDKYIDSTIMNEESSSATAEVKHVYANCKPILDASITAVTSSDSSITISNISGKVNLNVNRESNTQALRAEGHNGIEKNAKGELYSTLYYICDDNSEDFKEAITDPTETAVTLGDSVTLDDNLKIASAKTITIEDGAVVELGSGMTAAAAATINLNGTIQPTSGSTNKFVMESTSSSSTLTINGNGTITTNGLTGVAAIAATQNGNIKIDIKNGTIIGSTDAGCVSISPNTLLSSWTASIVTISGGIFKLYGWDEAPSYSAIPSTAKESLIKVNGIGYRLVGSSYKVIRLIDINDGIAVYSSSIVKISGGTFYGRDPKLGDDGRDPSATNTYLASGYKSVERTNEPGVFDVVPE